MTLAKEAHERAVNWSPSPSSSSSVGLFVGGDGPLSQQIPENSGLNFPKGTPLNSPEVTYGHLDPIQAAPRLATNSVNICGPKPFTQNISARMLNNVYDNYAVDSGSSVGSDLLHAPRKTFNGGIVSANSQVDSNGVYYIPRKCVILFIIWNLLF